MSAALPDHGRPDVSGPIDTSHSTRANFMTQTGSRMEEATQPSTPRSSVTNDTKGTTVVTGQTAATDTEPAPQVNKNARGEGKQVNKRSLDYVLRSGLAGGLAGCAAKTVVAPLDRVKILFQASNPQFAKYSGSWAGLASAVRDINQYEGLQGLFKGHSATLLRIFPYAAIKFLAYEQIRAVVIPSKENETPFRRLISGSIAGITSVFFTYPLEVVRVRLAFETKHASRTSLLDACRQIYNERVTPSTTPAPSATRATSAPATATAENVSAAVNKAVPRSGIANFYRGFAPTILGMFPYAGMSFLTHDTVGDWLRSPLISRYTTIPNSESSPTKSQHGSRPQLTAAAELFSGAVSGLVSQTTSYPLEVIRRRMQVGGAVGDGRRLRILETAQKVWLENGFRGFWVGLTIGYLKVVPMVATSFFVYERMKWSLGI